MTQIGFPRGEAHEALDQFLTGDRMERWIGTDDSDGYGQPLAYIVPAEAMHEYRKGYTNWMESEEQKTENDDLPPGYRPWQNSPLAGTDRLLPTEPLHEPLARMMFEKPYEELEETQQWRVRATAITCLLRVTFDPDGQGAVPVLTLGHDPDDPSAGLRWRIAFATDVPGLYVRETGNGFFGGEYGIVTGSGYKVWDGWYSKDGAATCAAALGRVLPHVDWMRLTPSGFTTAAKDAIQATVKRYGPWSDTDSTEPDPEPMTDAIPVAEVPAETTAK